MRPENLKAVEALREKIRVKEEEARQLKIVVNGFYTDENEEPPYPNASAKSDAMHGPLRTDHFYGKTLAQAAQVYLEMRKASGLGSAAVNDIYSALKSGGYNFDTKNEEYAKNGVRISLRKNDTIFHQLPGGDYGLCSWYGVKGTKEEQKPITRKKKFKFLKKSQTNAPDQEATNGHIAGDVDTAKEATRAERGIATNSGVITVGTLETFVREKNRRIGATASHFQVDEATIKKMLEPESKVYMIGKGWLKVRE